MRAIVIINEQHTLLGRQAEILSKKFSGWTVMSVPAAGWTISQQKEIARTWAAEHGTAVPVFVSPVPVVLAMLAKRRAVHVFAKDWRKKTETAAGLVISRVARDGWELIRC